MWDLIALQDAYQS
jgi:hypothetical protein